MDFFKESTSVEEMDELFKRYIDTRNEIANIEDSLKGYKEELNELQEKIFEAMESNLKTNWSVGGFNFTVSEREYAKLEKDPEKFKELESYLKEVGGDDLYYTYATVNHQSLQSLVKFIREERPEDESIPCIDTSFKKKSLSMRKAKK